jgi:tripartite-type tricarboxylate transporter receptor subunit TctC
MAIAQRLAAVLALLIAAAPSLRAAEPEWPTRPIRVVVPYPPGASNDIISRLMAEQLGRVLGQGVVIENKPGGGTAIGTRAVAGAAPDGYTLLFGTNPIVGNLYVLKNPQYRLEDFTLLAPIGTTSYVMLVSSRLPTATLPEFIAYAKERPGVLNYGSFSRGSSAQLLPERLKHLVGIDLVDVMYKGGSEALQGVLAGQIHVYFATIALTLAHADAPELRHLAITSAGRSPLLPEVPSFTELGYPEMTNDVWFAVFAPAATPPAIVARLRETLAEVARSPLMAERLTKLGAQPWGGSLDAFAAYMKEDERRIADDIRRFGVQLD